MTKQNTTEDDANAKTDPKAMEETFTSLKSALEVVFTSGVTSSGVASSGVAASPIF